MTIRIIAMKEKGRELSICKPEKLITTGIYGIIRHPMYLGSLFIFVGIATFSFHNFLQVGVLFYIIIHFIMDRIEREEYLLYYHFKDEFVNYRESVRSSLIPYLL